MNEQWNEALDQVKDKHLSEAVGYRPRHHWLKIVGSMAAALVLVVSWSILRPEPPVTDLTNDTPTESTIADQTTPTTDTPSNTEQPPLPLPEETQPIPTLPEETEPATTLPLPVETEPTTTTTLPEETQPFPTLPPPENTTPSELPSIDSFSQGITSPHLLSLPNLLAAPQYPTQTKCPDPDDYPSSDYYYAHREWQYLTQLEQPQSPDNARDLDPFMKAATGQFLSGSGNQVCAPMNIYFALAMLAETTGGSSRQQILNLLGHSSIESLRTQANQLWKAHYFDNGETASLMANSLWLDNRYSFYQNTVNSLAKNYFASVFRGDLSSDYMNRQLILWLNTQTGGLLSNHTQNIKLDPETVFGLASTAYFSADWDSTFWEGATEKEVFHCEGYDINTDFMHKTFLDYNYYVDPIFSAISLSLSGSHRMWLILPDEGYTPQDLLKQGNYYNLISGPGNWYDQGRYRINLSMPKFDVDCKQDLSSGLQALGITEVFKQTANFSSITDSDVSLGEISHAARVAVDEDGVIAAAYTIIAPAGSAMPPKNEEIDFVLNRPFLFVITGSDDLPLFSGVVNKP